MKWLLLAFVIFVQDNKADIKVNTALSFFDKDTCVSYAEKYESILIQGLRRNYPPMKEVTLVCATEEKAIEYKDKLLKKSTYDKV
tara:strand:+ start:83 stop:337 length:255 start_codon:yes stop_codon:yes gene_type:complete